MTVARFAFMDSRRIRIKDWRFTPNPSASDKHMRVFNSKKGIWVAPPPNLKPNPFREDRELYQEELGLFHLQA